jgi:hypothetical protein
MVEEENWETNLVHPHWKWIALDGPGCCVCACCTSSTVLGPKKLGSFESSPVPPCPWYLHWYLLCMYTRHESGFPVSTLCLKWRGASFASVLLSTVLLRATRTRTNSSVCCAIDVLLLSALRWLLQPGSYERRSDGRSRRTALSVVPSTGRADRRRHSIAVTSSWLA